MSRKSGAYLVLVKPLQVGLLFYDKYLDTSTTLINDSSLFRTIHPRFIARLH